MSWLTIESDPAVFSALISDLGVKGVDVTDILSIDADSLNALQPNFGVIFLFKYQDTDDSSRADSSLPNGDDQSASLLWFAHQKIQNACGTQALLALLLNHQDEIELGPELENFRDFTLQFPPDLRGDAMTNSDILRTTHNSFSQSEMFHLDETNHSSGGSEAPYHFISYTLVHGRLYELDGLRITPVDHGDCEPSEFGTKLSAVLMDRIARYKGELNFNLMGLTADPLASGNTTLSGADLQRELAKREERNRDVALRRHGFAGAIVAVTKALVQGKTREQLDSLITTGKKRTKQQQEKKLQRQRLSE